MYIYICTYINVLSQKSILQLLHVSSFPMLQVLFRTLSWLEPAQQPGSFPHTVSLEAQNHKCPQLLSDVSPDPELCVCSADCLFLYGLSLCHYSVFLGILLNHSDCQKVCKWQCPACWKQREIVITGCSDMFHRTSRCLEEMVGKTQGKRQ